MHRKVLFCLALLLPSALLAGETDPGDSTQSRRWYLPQYIPLQFAGNIGFLATGLGYSTRSNSYEINLLYGYVPPVVSNHAIHMITVKNIFPVFRQTLGKAHTLIPYLGLAASVEVGGNAFFANPSRFPDGYYDFPKNLRLTGFGGLKLRRLFIGEKRWLRGAELYVESGTVDVYVWYRTISNDIEFNQMFSLALGINLLLAH